MSKVRTDLQGKLLRLGGIIKQGLHSEQGRVFWAPEVLQPVGVHLPQPGVVCSGRPPAHDVSLLSCTVHPTAQHTPSKNLCCLFVMSAI